MSRFSDRNKYLKDVTLKLNNPYFLIFIDQCYWLIDKYLAQRLSEGRNVLSAEYQQLITDIIDRVHWCDIATLCVKHSNK